MYLSVSKAFVSVTDSFVSGSIIFDFGILMPLRYASSLFSHDRSIKPSENIDQQTFPLVFLKTICWDTLFLKRKFGISTFYCFGLISTIKLKTGILHIIISYFVTFVQELNQMSLKMLLLRTSDTQALNYSNVSISFQIKTNFLYVLRIKETRTVYRIELCVS